MSARPTGLSFDFGAMPLDATATLLRQVGETLLVHLVQRAPPPTLTSLIGGKELPLLLPYAWGRRAVPARRLMIGPWLRQIWWWLRPLPRGPWAPPDLTRGLGADLKRAADRAVAPERWATLATAWVDRSVGGVSAQWLAVPFWPLAGEIAWGDEALEIRTARAIQAALSRRVIFAPGPPPLPLLSPPSYWALIALAEIGKPRPWPPLPRARLILAGLRRLQLFGAEIALRPGWAGFWDQWVLSEALRLWPESASRADPRLRAALAALPIHSSLGEIPTPAEAQIPALAAPGWAREQPPWIDLLARWDREQPLSGTDDTEHSHV